MIYETKLRSIAKAVSWRAFSSLMTMAIVYIFTRRVGLALWVGAAETLLKIVLYFIHERTWNKLSLGRAAAEPAVVWFTGLSGSGKSTLAKRVFAALQERGLKAEYLDGDAIRKVFPETGFSRAERDLHVRRVGHLAAVLEKNGVFVVASLISPYEDSRRFVRGLCRNFVEVHVSTPLAVCEARDPKGLYALARRGEKPNFTGVNDPYEPPPRCEITVDTSRLSEEESFSRVMEHLALRRLGGFE
jgi:adenylylsulfate kinase